MGGIFGVASKSSCILDLFFGIDYHSHLGTRRGGMAVYDKKRGFDRVIHNIENAPFRTKFDGDIGEMEGNLGIGCISDNEPQPLLVRSHLGNFAITTVGKINNMDELIANCFKNGCTHFLEMSGGSVNPTEMVAALINQKDNMIEGIRYAQEVIEGSMTMLILTPKGILAARDRLGRTPLIVGKKEDACCVSFESFAYLNLGYEDLKELGPGEIVAVTPDGVETLQKPGEEMRICSFLWVYYGYPTSAYEGVNVEEMRYHCGDMLARRDRGEVNPDIVAGVPDSGIAHAIGYANQSGVPSMAPVMAITALVWAAKALAKATAESRFSSVTLSATSASTPLVVPAPEASVLLTVHPDVLSSLLCLLDCPINRICIDSGFWPSLYHRFLH